MRDVGEWLEQLGLGKYAEIFAENDLTPDVLSELTEVDLKELGMSMGDRKRILKAVARLDAETPGSDFGSPKSERSRTSSLPTSKAERRQLTVMFCDLVGSTSLAEQLDPEELRDVIAGCQEIWQMAIERYDGFVARYMGDGALAYFGYPKAHEDAAERAVRAGLEIITAMAAPGDNRRQKHGIELAVRVGIATGPVVVGDLGKGTAKESAAFGETPNLAARLQAVAVANTIVVSPGTHRLTEGQFDYRDLGERDLKGIGEPVRAWQVLGEGGAESRFDALYGQKITPLVGRAEELAILANRWEHTKESEGQVVLISGEPGIGKSRLCETIAAQISEEPQHTLRYQCSPHHTNTAYYPVIRHLQHAAGFSAKDTETERLDKLEELLKTSNDIEVELPLLADLLSVSLSARYSPPPFDAQHKKERTIRSLIGLIDRLSDVRPVLIVFEDLHWVDPSTMEFLARLVEKAEDDRLLMLITFRPEIEAPWMAHAHRTLLTLNRISNRETRTMLRELSGPYQLSEGIIGELVEKADGVPLFIEEMTRAVLETEIRVPNGSEVTSLEVPATLQDSLMARLDRLQTAKPVAQIGAAIGREFTREILDSVCEMTPSDVDRAVNELVDTGLVFLRGGELGRTCVFKHALVQDAAYNSLLLADRVKIHRRIAEMLDGSNFDQPALLAHHWERAGDLEKALEFRLQAADRATELDAVAERDAQNWHVLDILERLPETPERRMAYVKMIQTMYRDTFWRTDEEYQQALRHLESALDIASDLDDDASRTSLLAYRGRHWTGEGDLIQAAEDAKSLGDKRLQAEIEDRFSGYFGQRGQFDDSNVHAVRAIELWDEIGDVLETGFSMAGAGRCHHSRAGKLEESLEFARRARAIAESTGNLELKAWTAMESEPYMYQGLWEQAIEAAEAGLPIAWEIGHWRVIMFSSAWATIAYTKLQQLQEAENLMERALKGADPRIGDNYTRVYLRFALSQLRLAQSQLDAALAAAEHAAELTDLKTMGVEHGVVPRVLGQALEAMGRRDEAEIEFRRSLDRLGKIQSKPELGQTLLAYGRFKDEDDKDQGRQLLTKALEIFDDINAPGWIAETRVALDT
ncbi:MAG: AAA family ATPase [Gammaproteobacteria bacterium]|nr:AAA family ATPase [Gammaproteobacteria bacterium]NIP88530.1 AAA family ATPase [Gammaproteobacteria bacterium]NIR23251.1 AAA family ATPase [Gammaproteobacteria bacterium]NIS04822.1 AAA family ATPase [Gammaproteobacteria bacterium]NIU40100.1 AAA family ATPase [Gammaproteobacteria bacterium]